MVTVGFWFEAPFEYAGGLNYLRNLLYALSTVNDGTIRPVIFFAADLPPRIEAEFAPLAKVVKTKLLQRRTIPWLMERVANRALGSMRLVTRLLRRHRVDVLSHAWFEYKGRPPFRVIAWLPDFQYLHLPELFPGLDSAAETARLRRIVAGSDRVIVSSHDALRDYQTIAPPEAHDRATVLHFVSQPRSGSTQQPTREEMERRHGVSGRYFFLPNQFWVHKNHLTVFQAVKIAKDRGLTLQVICTGSTRDLRLRRDSPFAELLAFIDRHDLHDNIRILGHVDYDDVLFLMRHSVAVLNPSRFEGWSSSVEEAKSMGRPVLLSRIDVHVEQDPPGGRYFEPNDSEGLATILEEVWRNFDTAPAAVLEEEATRRLEARTREYGRHYMDLVRLVAPEGGRS